MQRYMVSKALASSDKILRPVMTQVLPKNYSKIPHDVFINHRGVDTKKTIAGLLFQHLSSLGFNSFLDSKSMKPGDKLYEKIDPAIKSCRVGIAVFSPNYCDSYFCLHELALMLEYKKKIIPIFCDVKPSELQIKDDGRCSPKELEKFSRAIEEARNIVGLTFDTKKGDWSEFLTSATDSILQSLHETEEDEKYHHTKKITKYYAENPSKIANY